MAQLCSPVAVPWYMTVIKPHSNGAEVNAVDQPLLPTKQSHAASLVETLENRKENSGGGADLQKKRGSSSAAQGWAWSFR